MTSIEFWGLVVDSLSALLSAIAILLYIVLWYKEKTSNNYHTFDSTYLEILKTGIEYPTFRDKDFTVNYLSAERENRIQYEIYAFMCWNFCETIYDQGDSSLIITWGVILEEENRLHRKWFDHPDNYSKFKESFREFIMHKYQSEY